MIDDFYKSRTCNGERSCALCRELSPRGEQFRTTMQQAFFIDEREFACRVGKEFVSCSVSEIVYGEPETRVETLVEKQKNRRVLDVFCRPCEDSVKESVLGYELVFCGTPIVGGNGNCGCVMNVKTRIPGAKCPKGKW